MKGDVRNPDDLALKGVSPDLILECSAEPSVLAGYGDSTLYMVQTNLMGTVNCLELARKTRADVLFLSTSRVYPLAALNSLHFRETESRFEFEPSQTVVGASEKGVSEDFPLGGSRTLYGATKLASELLIWEYHDAFGVRSLVNRCGVIAGPWQMGKTDQGVFTHWVASAHFNKPLRYIGWGGTGKQVRDLLHIDDLADLVMIQLAGFGKLAGRVFNVGGGPSSSLSLLETTRLCEEIVGKKLDVGPAQEERPGDVKWYVTDNARVSEATGWRPTRSPKDTLRSIHDWMSSNEPLVSKIFK